MENKPEIRIVGNASEKKKEGARDAIKQARFNHMESLLPEEREQLEKFEYPKNETQLALIDFANQETSRLMQEAGIAPYTIPEENFHVISSDFYEQITDGGVAMASMTKQGIILDVDNFFNKPVNFGATAIHELLHLKAYFSVEMQEDEDGAAHSTPYREGVGVRALQRHGLHGRYHRHFTGLHEAIVSETEKRLLSKLIDHPALEAEKQWLASEEAQEKKERIAQKNNITVNDIFWVDRETENDWQSISYSYQREVLNYVCSEIQEKFPEIFHKPDDVYKMFLNANFTGNLTPIARLVEDTFGEGSFRILGNMETDEQSGILHLESLKKMRTREKRE